MISEQPLYVVEVEDHCLAELTGHAAWTYSSPLQPAGQALALVRALLACPPATLDVDDTLWHRAIPGGRRAIRLYRMAHSNVGLTGNASSHGTPP